ncbi:hypothetical protein X975_18750, partial [Stegodyphus mimosarum]
TVYRSSHYFGASLLARDGLHLNRLGNKKLASVFLDNIKSVLTSQPVSTKVSPFVLPCVSFTVLDFPPLS